MAECEAIGKHIGGNGIFRLHCEEPGMCIAGPDEAEGAAGRVRFGEIVFELTV